MVSMETGWLSLPTEVAISEVGALLRVDLRVSVEVAYTLDVHHNQLMAGALKCEVAEGLWGDRKKKGTAKDQAVGSSASCYSERVGHPALPMVACLEEKTKEGALFNLAGTSYR